MFDRKSESASEGFAIDEPVQLSTMWASWFILLKVISHHGEHLICLDTRKKNGVDYADSDATDSSYLCCLEMPSREATEETAVGRKSGKAPKKILYLLRNGIGWRKLIGLFVGDAVFE